MDNKIHDDHIYQEAHIAPATVEQISVKTEKAVKLPPCGDQTHVLVEDGEDPWVISHEDKFYYCTVDRQKRSIMISTFTDLKDMAKAELVQVWPNNHEQTPEYQEIWAPELQFVDGKWYIYFALFSGKTGKERMWVLEGKTTNPQAEYECKGQLQIATDRWAIDGTVMALENGDKYFIWSGWDGFENVSQNIYIAKMSNPWTISSDRYCISRPEYDWEKQGNPHVNEGPQVLMRDGKIFIIYSASGSWTDDYCLGQLTYVGGDFLEESSWRKEPQSVFCKTDTIFAPGHASFVNSKGQDYIIYHTARCSNAGWARQIRWKPFTWKADGSPDFGQPI